MVERSREYLLETHNPDRLEGDALRSGLQDLGCAGIKVAVRSRVDSTNAVAKGMASEGVGPWALVAAEEQWAGRGRRGRQWVSGPGGNLYFTLLTPLPFPAALGPWVPLVAALSVWEVLQESGVRVDLKWPNDLLADGGAKLGGVLVENASAPSGSTCLAVGVGINVNAPPSQRDAAALVGMTGCPWDRNRLLVAMVCRVRQWFDCLSREGVTKVREAWIRACSWIGEEVVILTEDGSREGRFVGLDGFGRMILDTAGNGLQRYSAGDVSLRRAGGAPS